MSENLICPDCGHENPAGSTSCGRCNFPLGPAAPPAGGASGTRPAGPPGLPPRPLRRRPRPRPQPYQALTLWLMFGVVAAASLIYVGFTAFQKSNTVAVEGASTGQQRTADSLRAVVASDSNSVAARIALGNVLYDTANWPEAIVQYRAAIRRDSTRATALVDLGVCYFNLGDSPQAESLFLLALERDPRLTQALFNLGIVYENREEYGKALQYLHRAMQASPADSGLHTALLAAMQRVMEKTGEKPRPLP